MRLNLTILRTSYRIHNYSILNFIFVKENGGLGAEPPVRAVQAKRWTGRAKRGAAYVRRLRRIDHERLKGTPRLKRNYAQRAYTGRKSGVPFPLRKCFWVCRARRKACMEATPLYKAPPPLGGIDGAPRRPYGRPLPFCLFAFPLISSFLFSLFPGMNP